MKYPKWLFLLMITVSIIGCQKKEEVQKLEQPVYQDIAYLQDYSIKYDFKDTLLIPQKVATDRNGIIQILASNKLFRPNNGHFQYPGDLLPDHNYIPMADMKITDLISYQDQFVYLTDQSVLSNAWAGKLLSKHKLHQAKTFCGGADFDFLLSDGSSWSI